MEQTVAHKQIASQCFNKVWDFLDMKESTLQEQEQMIHLAHTSFWHWTQVEEHTPTNLSIGYWQISRVYAIVGNGDQALFFANRCVEVSLKAELPPFYIGYAYEAMARAYQVQKNKEEAMGAYQKALNLADEILVEDSKNMLLKDLEEVREFI